MGEILAQRFRGQHEIESSSRDVYGKEPNREMQAGPVKEQQHRVLPALVPQQAARLRKFHVQVHQQPGHQAQSHGDDGDREFA